MLEVVSSILQAYQNDHGLRMVPIKTHLIKPLVEKWGHVDRISIEEVDFHAPNIVARIIKYQSQDGVYSETLDHASIQYTRNHNLCWRRFGVCKEMYHCMIDASREDRVATVDQLGRVFDLLVADSTSITGSFAPHEREEQAEFLALETLLPVEHRIELKPRLESGELDYWKIADRFKIPEIYTRLAFQETYFAATRELRGNLLDLRS